MTQNGRQPIEADGESVSLIGQTPVAPGDWQLHVIALKSLLITEHPDVMICE